MQRYSSAGPGLFASQQDACHNPCLRVRACVYIYTPCGVYTIHTQGRSVHTGVCTPMASRRWRGYAYNALSQPLQVASWALGPWHSSPVPVPLYQCRTCQPGLPPPCPAAWWVAWGQDLPQRTACPKRCAGCWGSTLPRGAPCWQSRFHGKRTGVQLCPVLNLVPWRHQASWAKDQIPL